MEEEKKPEPQAEKWEESEKWECVLCTFQNIGRIKCDLCGTSRYSQPDATSDAVKEQAELLSPQWSCPRCTFGNIKNARRCAKCDGSKAEMFSDGPPPAKPLTIRSHSPRHDRPPAFGSYGGVEIQKDPNAPLDAQTKWICPRCTYLNYVKAIRCTMCSLPLNGPPKSVLFPK
ncbi:Ubiquitin thioesterase trabid [Aphelenchoides fujianensis]|nr:Ubiquitin thioesterase trabid [Aphelenchoides fujianensis]